MIQRTNIERTRERAVVEELSRPEHELLGHLCLEICRTLDDGFERLVAANARDAKLIIDALTEASGDNHAKRSRRVG